MDTLPPGDDIAVVRELNGMSLKDVAELADTSPQTVANIEHGGDGLWSKVVAIITALGGRVEVKWPVRPAASRAGETADA
jgi:transcriptional regulator with XRE-family HTH domain